MNRLLLLLAVLLSVQGQARADDPAGLTSLEPLRWERRVVLLFAEPGAAAEALRELRETEEALEDRDMSWFLVETGQVTASNHAAPLDARLGSALMERYAPEPVPLEVLLIGKDGGVKARDSVFTLEALLGQVDRMPMRRRELRERWD